MNLDQDTLIFLVEYYEALANDRTRLETAYTENAKVIVQFRETPQRIFTNKFGSIPPKGKRKILHVDSCQFNNYKFVHVLSDLIQPNSSSRVDECFHLIITDSNIFINYQSIHINPFLDIIKLLPPSWYSLWYRTMPSKGTSEF